MSKSQGQNKRLLAVCGKGGVGKTAFTSMMSRVLLESGKAGNLLRLLAVCGKGGVGKTAFTSMMSRVLLESGKAGNLLLIDADPAMGLPNALGIDVRHTMGQVRENIIETARKGKKKETVQLVDTLDYMALEALIETDDFALLAMGRTETLGCYCPVNDLLRGAIESLSKSFDTIIIDGEAGLEQHRW
jgi:CO dehydrogenase maturation factor